MAITLPPSRILGDSGHVTDHATIRTALSDLDTAVAAKAPSASPTFTGNVALPSTTTLGGVTLTGGGLTYVTKGDAATASAVSVNSCFTSTYDMYRIVLTSASASAASSLSFRLRVGGVDASGANYNQYGLAADVSAVASNSGTGNTNFTWCTNSTAQGAVAVMDIFRPALAVHTGLFVTGSNWNAGNMTQSFIVHQVTTAYDGFTVTASSGTFTGTVYIYGYRKA